MNADKEEIKNIEGKVPEKSPQTCWKKPIKKSEYLFAASVLVFALALAYGPAKMAGHSIYGGVVQDLTNLYGFYCWDEFTHSELQAGRFPLWNPHNAFGVPHLANMQSAVLYPLNWLKWAFGFWPVIDAVLMLRLFAAGFFTWLFTRRALALGFWPSLTAAAAYMLTGYFTRYVYMSHLNVEALLPLQLLLLHRMAQRRSMGSMVLAGLGFALLILGGFPEATLYAFVFSIAYYLIVAPAACRQLLPPGRRRYFAPGRALPLLGLLAGAVALGLIIALPQWLPFAEYYAQAWTYHDPLSGMRRHDPRLCISLILPWFFGENSVSPVAPFLTPYLGVVPVLLAGFLALRLPRAKAPDLFFPAAAVALFSLIYGLPPLSLVGRVFPFNLTYNDKYAVPALALCVAIAAGAGLDHLERKNNWKTFALVAGIMLFLIGLNTVGGYRNWFRPAWALGLLKPGVTLTGAMVAVIAAALAVMAGKGMIGRKAMSGGIFALCLIGLVFDQLGNTPMYHDDLSARSAALAQTPEPSHGRFRVYADPELDSVFPDRLLPAGVDDVRYYDPLYPGSYVEFMATVNGLSGDALIRHYNDNMIFAIGRDHLEDPLLNLSNTAVYMFDLPIDERPLAREWAQRATTVGPRHESWLRAEETVAGGDARLAVMDHAPVKIMVPAFTRAARSFIFSAGVPDSQVFAPGRRGDGVCFIVTGNEHPPALLYARYLDPKRRRDDLGWKPASVSLLTTGIDAGRRSAVKNAVLALLPGPRNDSTRDAVALARPRLKEKRPKGEFKPAKEPKGPVPVYQDQGALPRAWWVGGYSLPVNEGEYFKELHDTAMRAPSTFTRLVVLKRAPAGPTDAKKATVKTPVFKLTRYGPGAITAETAHEKPGFIVIADQYLPGWRAYLESGGQRSEAQVLPANGPFLAVPAPAGEWTMELKYCPWSFKIGLWAALACAACMVPAWMAAPRRRRPGPA
ncbi:MAG TPA: hypothetical protein VM658_10720 [bacterium]|nr:hypothetical protein [bacterium]